MNFKQDCGLFSYLLRHHIRTTSSFLVLLAFIWLCPSVPLPLHLPLPPSAVTGCSSRPPTHLTLHQKHCVLHHFNHISSSHHVLLLSSLLCSLLSRHSQWKPRPFTSAPTSFPLLPPPISLLYILFIHPLGRTFTGDGHLPTLWNKSSVSILADIVADDTHTLARTHTPWQLYSSLYIGWFSFGSEVQGLFDRLPIGPETLLHPG